MTALEEQLPSVVARSNYHLFRRGTWKEFSYKCRLCLWRNRSCSVGYWWEFWQGMGSLCNCCLFGGCAWTLPDRCVYRAVDVGMNTRILCVVTHLLNFVTSFSRHPSLVCHSEKPSCQQNTMSALLGSSLPQVLLCPCLFGIFTSQIYWRKTPSELTQEASMSTCQKAVLILPGCLSLFSSPGTIRGMWSWFREGFVLSHCCDSDIWEERRKKNVVIFEEDIPIDSSDWSLANKEVASPGWEKTLFITSDHNPFLVRRELWFCRDTEHSSPLLEKDVTKRKHLLFQAGSNALEPLHMVPFWSA